MASATPSPTSPVRAALFDLDGTLVRTFIDFPAMRAAVRERAAAWGTEYALIAQQADDILEIVRQVTACFPESDRPAVYADLNAVLERYEEEGCAHPVALDDASRLLADLRAADIRIGIVTRNARRIARDVLERMELRADTVIAREDTHHFKPHPEPVLVTCARLGVPPAASLMVGDLWADIASAQAAGVPVTIAIHWPHDPPDRFARVQPSYRVTSLSEASGIIRYYFP